MNYYHLLSGGHVAAARRHSDAPHLAKLDLARFYHQISRTKVHRSLKAISISQDDAWEAACDSTVEKDKGQRNFSLPFGFIQSPLLASVALDHSALGTTIARINDAICPVSIYVDDIIVSAHDAASVEHALHEIRDAADTSGFAINDAKSEGPASEITAFNIRIGSGRMEITTDRMDEFMEGVRRGSEEQVAGILNYVASVNRDQMEALAAHRG